jgi:hypothetical protein
MNEKYPSDTISKTFTFTDEDDVVFDPDTIALVIKDSSGTTITTKAISDFTHDATGVYTITYALPSNAAAGTWTFEVTATQTASSKTNKETFEFKVLSVRQHYGSSERVKRLANLDATDTAQDDKVDDALSDADTAIEAKLAECSATVPLTGTVAEKIRVIAEFLAAGTILWVNDPQEKEHPFTTYALKQLQEYLNATYTTGSGGLPIAIGNDDP